MLCYGKYQEFPDERHDLDGLVGVRQRAHMLGDTSLQGGWMGGDGGKAGPRMRLRLPPSAVEGASPPLAEPVL